MKKPASELKAGDTISRFGIPCEVVSVEAATHPIGGEVVRVRHTNGKGNAELSFKPSHLVDLIAR